MTVQTASAPPSPVQIVEVGPRDGLQNIPGTVSTSTKCELIQRLRLAGLTAIELTSVVSPRAVPQLADCRELLGDSYVQELLHQAQSRAQRGHTEDHRPAAATSIRCPVLVPNVKGLEIALDQGVKEVAVFISATEGFSRANINCSVDQGIARAREVTRLAIKAGVAVRGYVSCIFEDPFDGPTPHTAVLHCVKSLLDAGCHEISLGDTLGVGSPANVHSLLDYLTCHDIPIDRLAGHFHDTYGQAVANVWEAYRHGVRVFDSSVAGLGGCPYAPGAKGNVATEDVVYMFHNAGIGTGVDLIQLAETGEWISQELDQMNASRVGKALLGRERIRESRQRQQQQQEKERKKEEEEKKKEEKETHSSSTGSTSTLVKFAPPSCIPTAQISLKWTLMSSPSSSSSSSSPSSSSVTCWIPSDKNQLPTNSRTQFQTCQQRA